MLTCRIRGRCVCGAAVVAPGVRFGCVIVVCRASRRDGPGGLLFVSAVTVHRCTPDPRDQERLDGEADPEERFGPEWRVGRACAHEHLDIGGEYRDEQQDETAPGERPDLRDEDADAARHFREP